MTGQRSRRRQLGVRAAVIAVLIAAGARIYQAMSGTIAIQQAATEVAAGVGLIGIAAVVIVLWPETRTAGRALQGVTTLAWAALVLIPTWRLGHQPDPLFDGVLAGAEREVTVGPVATGATYELVVSGPRERSLDEYTLVVKVGGRQRKLRGVFGAESDVTPLALSEGDMVTVFIERGSAASVVIRLPRIPWRWIQLGALFVIVLTCVAEVFVSRSRPRIRGLWTGVVSVSVLYLLMLDPTGVSGGAAVGAAMGALAAGGLLGAIWGAMVGRIHRRA